jgi:hypothetical protein
MPWFFFHLRRNGQIIPDPEGARLTGIDEAQAEAKLAARELIIDHLKTNQPLLLDDGIDVTDEHGTVYYTVTFEEALGLGH